MYGDITSRKDVKKAVKGCDRVYHQASLLNHNSPTHEEFIKVNADGTRNIMEACLDEGVERVVHTSSRVTINEEGSGRIDADYIHRGFFDNVYAMSKYRGEKIAFEYGARGLPVVVLCPTLVYGPRETHTTGPLIKAYLEMKVRFAAYLSSKFNLVHVRDVVDANIAAMKKGRKGHRYILGGVEISIGDFLKMLDEIAGVKRPIITMPNSLASGFVAYAGPILKKAGIELPVSKEQIYAMKTDTLVDIGKSKKDLGLKVTPLRQGLEETIKWYKDTGYVKLS